MLPVGQAEEQRRTLRRLSPQGHRLRRPHRRPSPSRRRQRDRTALPTDHDRGRGRRPVPLRRHRIVPSWDRSAKRLFRDETIGIVGLGGSGEYILDAVSKTPVADIYIFDGDEFLTHNAFRAPGAPTQDQLDARPLKVDHFADIYDRIRRGIHRHPYEVTEDNVNRLGDLSFVFVAIDDAEAKEPIIRFLIEADIPFLDIGMGVEVIDSRLTGSLRTTLVTPSRNHHAVDRIPTVNVLHEDDTYRSNIQIAELNMANAALAVIAWKRYRSFYADLDSAHHSMFSIASNRVANDEYADDSAGTEGGAA